MYTKFELLPNEIVIECFQYLTPAYIFYSFDQLNYRLHTLTRNILLHINFQNIRKSIFDGFCHKLAKNPEIKSQIISLQLANKVVYEQIQAFLSLVPLNELVHLRSLILINLNADIAKQIKIMLPFLTNLSYFSCTTDFGLSDILPVPQQYFDSMSIKQATSLTSIMISRCDANELCHLFKCAPMLRYLKIKQFFLSDLREETMRLYDVPAVHLKHFIMEYCGLNFKELEEFLKLMPNLTNLIISGTNDTKGPFNADDWKSLIITSLLYLHTFKFKWDIELNNQNKDILGIFQQYQTDFWLNKHSWFTNYEIHRESAIIYTIPYTSDHYNLIPIENKHANPTIHTSGIFNNAKNLTLVIDALKNDYPYYFPAVESLTLMNKYTFYGERIYRLFGFQHIEYMKAIVNLSNLTHLCILRGIQIESSAIMLQMLRGAPQLSSMKIDTPLLISFLDDVELCKYLNEKIKNLNVYSDVGWPFIKSNRRDLFCERFSNLEQLQCSFEKPDDLLFLLTRLIKLSMIGYEYIIGTFPETQYEWLKENTSKLNMDFLFRMDNTTIMSDSKYCIVKCRLSYMWIGRPCSNYAQWGSQNF
ncbi:unnamed protein product [Adineta steineri]|uniref:F-box domain-containing protein n=1 Tax=Adineta steineri TaxID=433720 RepID=A0A819EYT0_9BILA|nr:unnamed protein product [Adineta steineri]CAF3858815.1 unnamed protein product [Adineta steineri]